MHRVKNWPTNEIAFVHMPGTAEVTVKNGLAEHTLIPNDEEEVSRRIRCIEARLI